VFVGRLNGQWGKSHRHGQGDMISDGARGQRPAVSGVRAVDPDRGFDQAPEFRILRAVFELNIEPVVSGFPHAFARQEQAMIPGCNGMSWFGTSRLSVG